MLVAAFFAKVGEENTRRPCSATSSSKRRSVIYRMLLKEL